MTRIKLMACPDNRPSCGAGVCVCVRLRDVINTLTHRPQGGPLGSSGVLNKYGPHTGFNCADE